MCKCGFNRIVAALVFLVATGFFGFYVGYLCGWNDLVEEIKKQVSQQHNTTPQRMNKENKGEYDI